MHGRVAVHLAGRGEQEPGSVGFGDIQRVLGSPAAHRERLQREALVIGRGCRTGEVGDHVDRTIDIDPGAHIAFGKLEPGMACQMSDIFRVPGREVVQAHDPVTPGD